MQIGEYIERLKSTKTYKDRLITLQEYNYTTRFGIFPVPPQLPKADLDKHHIVMKITGGQPYLVGVITDQGSSYTPTSQDDGNLLFLTVQMKPQSMAIASPISGYQLGDGHYINAEFRIRYCVKNAESLWHGSDDPLSDLQLKIIDTAKEYFLGIKSPSLISNLFERKQDLEQQVHDNDLWGVKNKVQRVIKDGHIDGIELLEVNADIHLSAALKAHLDRIHKTFYDEGGHVDTTNKQKLVDAERKQIDERIDQDTTFPGYNLRQIILAVDSELLENFHTESWSTAMRKVHAGIAKKKQEVMRQQDERELERLEKLLQRAEKLNLGKLATDQIRSEIGDKIFAMVKAEQDPQIYSNEMFFTTLIGPPSTTQQQISGKASPRLPTTIDTDLEEPQEN